MELTSEAISVIFGFIALSGGVIATYVALVIKITKLDTKVSHIEVELKDEKTANEKYKEESTRQFAGIYRAINEVKLLIERKLK